MNKWVERLTIFVVGAVFAGGGFYAATQIHISNNAEAIEEAKQERILMNSSLKNVSYKIVGLEKDIEYIRNGIDEIKRKLK